jgi:hypothetical protein
VTRTLGYRCGYVVGKLLPISAIIWLLREYTTRLAPFTKPNGAKEKQPTPRAVGPVTPMLGPVCGPPAEATVESVIDELSDTFVVIPLPHIRLNEIN